MRGIGVGVGGGVGRGEAPGRGDAVGLGVGAGGVGWSQEARRRMAGSTPARQRRGSLAARDVFLSALNAQPPTFYV